MTKSATGDQPVVLGRNLDALHGRRPEETRKDEETVSDTQDEPMALAPARINGSQFAPPDPTTVATRSLKKRSESKTAYRARVVESEILREESWLRRHCNHRKGRFAVCNNKGGSGKTALVVLIGAILSEVTRQKVVLFDNNTGSGPLHPRIAIRREDTLQVRQLFKNLPLIRKYRKGVGMLPIGAHGLCCVASDTTAWEMEVELSLNDFAEIFDFVTDNSDYMIIDTNNFPHSIPSVAAVEAAETIVLVCKTWEEDSINGIGETIERYTDGFVKKLAHMTSRSTKDVEVQAEAIRQKVLNAIVVVMGAEPSEINMYRRRFGTSGPIICVPKDDIGMGAKEIDPEKKQIVSLPRLGRETYLALLQVAREIVSRFPETHFDDGLSKPLVAPNIPLDELDELIRTS